MILPVVLLLAQSAAAPAAGEKVFLATCAVGYCHGVGGAANRGPRLRGRTFEAGYVERVVRHGIPNSAMPAFESRLSQADLTAVVAYVTGIAGATAPGTAAPAAPEAPKPAALPAEAAAGRSLFQDATRENRCAVCHQAGGTEPKAGPDVVAAARRDPQGLMAAIRASRATTVRRVVLRSGEAFPARVAAETPQLVRVYDLSGLPPVLRTLRRAEVVSLEPDPEWNHARAAAGYSDAELTEIGRYLEWLGAAR